MGNYTVNVTLSALDDAVDERSERRAVLRGGSHPRYAAGHLVFARAGTILSAPFDLTTLEVTGPPTPRVENVATHPVLGAAHFEIAADGTLYFADAPHSAEAMNRVPRYASSAPSERAAATACPVLIAPAATTGTERLSRNHGMSVYG